jgi:hypothetical protein
MLRAITKQGIAYILRGPWLQQGNLSPQASFQPPMHSLDLSHLPIELLLSITAFLPPESVAALGLISKGFFSFVSIARSQLRSDALIKQRFLLLLEEDLPDYLLCHTCNKLYNWRTSPILVSPYRYTCPARRRDPSAHPSFARLCGCHPISSLHLGIRVSNMQREIRDLILRASRKGSEFGLPLSYIAHECVVSQYYSDLPTPISVKLLPKIVAGSLLLRRVEEIVIDLSIGLAQQLHALRACGCSHVSWSLVAITKCALQHVLEEERTDVANLSQQPKSDRKCQNLFQCSYCATDFRIHVITTTTSPGEVSIQVETWQNFGNGPHRGNAQDELFNSIPWRPHADDVRLRDLEKLYTKGSQLVASRSGGVGHDTWVAQDYCWYSEEEEGSLNKLPDF